MMIGGRHGWLMLKEVVVVVALGVVQWFVDVDRSRMEAESRTSGTKMAGRTGN